VLAFTSACRLALFRLVLLQSYVVNHHLLSNVMHRHVAYVAPKETAFCAKCIFAKLSDGLSEYYIDSGFISFIHLIIAKRTRYANKQNRPMQISKTTVMQGLGFTAGQ